LYVLQILVSYVAQTVVKSDFYTELQSTFKRLTRSTYDVKYQFFFCKKITKKLEMSGRTATI